MIVLVTVVVVAILVYLYTLADQRRHGCAAPHHVRSFPLGLRAAYSQYRSYINHELNPDTFDGFAKEGKRTMKLQTISRSLLLTHAHENIKAVLATQFNDFDVGDRQQYFYRLLGKGIFTSGGRDWQHSRIMLRPQFSTEKVSRLHGLERSVQDLTFILKNSNGMVDMQELLFKMTLDTASEFLFGESTDSLSGGKRLSAERAAAADNFQTSLNCAQDYLLQRAMAQKLYFMVGGSKFNTASDNCKRFVEYYVERAINSPKQDGKQDGDVFLNELTKQTTDPVVMRDQALNVLMAGRDTTAGTLSFALALLVKHQHIWRKMREAVLTDFGTGTDNITFVTLKKCKYLKHVINEVLRLFPIVPSNFRQAVRDTTLPVGGGPNEDEPIFVPNGSLIYFHTYSLHRDREYWGSDADEFRPERWAEPAKAQVSWRYIPFNGGPRTCLGQQFALTEIAYTLTRLAQTFEQISSTPEFLNADIKQRSTISVCVAGGVPMQFHAG